MRKILVAMTVGMVVGVGVPTATAHGDHDVEIHDGAFLPERLEIRAGDTVEWRNEGQRPHSVTADDGTLDSGILEPGSDFEMRFDEPGTFRYGSTAVGDGGMAGVVMVLPAEEEASSGSSGDDGAGEDGSERVAADDPGEGATGDGTSAGGAVTEGDSLDSTRPAGSEPESQSAGVARGGPVLAQAAAVTIQDDVFVPRTVEIEAGETVVWEHAGENPHTVTADDGSFDSGSLNTGDSFSQTFSQPGTYSYHCRFHGSPGQGMTGSVVVQEAPGHAEGEAPGVGEQDGGLAATGRPLLIPLGAAGVLLGAGLWLVRRSGSGLSRL